MLTIASLVSEEPESHIWCISRYLKECRHLSGQADCKSAQLENLVAIELIRRYGLENVYFFENNVEIDFYVPSQKLAIQVSMQVLDNMDTKERETRAFVKLNNFIPDVKCILITNSEEGTLNLDGIQIDVVPVWKWLLDSR